MNRIPAEEGGDLYLTNGNMTKLKDASCGSKSNGPTSADGKGNTL
jgi:hypothetical protein